MCRRIRYSPLFGRSAAGALVGGRRSVEVSPQSSVTVDSERDHLRDADFYVKSSLIRLEGSDLAMPGVEQLNEVVARRRFGGEIDRNDTAISGGPDVDDFRRGRVLDTPSEVIYSDLSQRSPAQ